MKGLLFILLFAIFAIINRAYGEVEIQINYGNSFQVFHHNKPSKIINPNFTTLVGDPYIRNPQRLYYRTINTQLDCDNNQFHNSSSGSTIMNYFYRDSESITVSPFWPNNLWSLFRSDNITCHYNWQVLLTNQLTKQPIFIIGDFDSPEQLNLPQQMAPDISPHFPLHSIFTLTKPE